MTISIELHANPKEIPELPPLEEPQSPDTYEPFPNQTPEPEPIHKPESPLDPEQSYSDVITRFLRQDERLILSDEQEMPLVIEAKNHSNEIFLSKFLASNSERIINDMAKYGAVLLRGFDISSDEAFERIILSIPEFRGISEAFMSEYGRDPVGKLQYVLQTNSVYKTGGTYYLGGFHTENYYSADVPGFICFFCLKPSLLGGETGIINTQKVFNDLPDYLKEKLEKKSYFVKKWPVAFVSSRYKKTEKQVCDIASQFNLPILRKGKKPSVLMYKPNVLIHPITQEKSLQINMFELKKLNHALRKCFIKDYQGKNWFWHRFIWRIPPALFNFIEFFAVILIPFFKSPKKSLQFLFDKIKNSDDTAGFDDTGVESCFETQDIKNLAQSMRKHYSSCLWQKGDILLVDNKKVMHAGMPGSGSRTIRAMIGNPLDMQYSGEGKGCIEAIERIETVGDAMSHSLKESI